MNNIYNNIIRLGKVSSIDPTHATARVFFDDKEDLVSHDLPIIIPQSLKNKDYYMPDIGEKVVCIFLPNGIQQGFILGSFYSKVEVPPVTDPNKRHTVFLDGTYFEYDRLQHLWQCIINGTTIFKTKELIFANNNATFGKVASSHSTVDTAQGENLKSFNGMLAAAAPSDSEIGQFTIPSNSAWNFKVSIAAKSGEDVAGWNIEGVATYNRFVSNPSITEWKDPGAGAWNVIPVVEGDKLKLKISVDKDVRFSTKFEAVEVTT